MLVAFQGKGVFCVDFSAIIIYHTKGHFSNARVRVCEKKAKKKTEIAGNGLSGRFKAMFGIEIFCREAKAKETGFPRLFRENDRFALDFSPFGGIL